MGFCRQEYWNGLPFPSPMLSVYNNNVIGCEGGGGRGTHMENGIKTQQKVEVRQQIYSLLGVGKSRKLCNTIRKRKGVIPFAQK